MIPRVLTFVTQFTGTEVAGLEAQLFREFTKLSKLTNLIVITEKSSKNIKNIQILKSISIPIPKLRALIKIISYLYFTLIKQNSYDLVYVRTFSPPELLAAIFAKKFLKKPVVTLVPGTWMLIGNGMKKKLYRYLYWKTLNISDRLVFYSHLMKPETEKIIGILENSQDVIIRNSVDADFFKPDKNLISKNSILFVGRIHPLKHIENIIDAVVIAHESINDIQLLIVGKYEQNKYFKELTSQIKKLRCKNYVHFIGPIPNEKILNYYQSSSIFVLLGVGEGMPKSILEAMACGIPVISVPNAGIPDVIKSGENGYLVPNNCPKAIAEKIIILLNDHSKLSDMGLAARMSMKNEFTWNNFIEQLSNLFRSLL